MHIKDYAEDLAKELANNHSKFTNFVWSEEPEDSDKCTIVYLSTRDSGLLEKSNEKAILAALEETGDGDNFWKECHSYWGCGYVNALVMRVYDSSGEVTPAFLKYAEMKGRIKDYPVLNEEDYSEAELEACIDNIERELQRLGDKASEVYCWFSENQPSAIESSDDQGACPSKQEILQALKALEILVEE